MRILLISPNIRGMKNGINRIQPSLGIGYIASVARNDGCEIFVRDTALEGYHNQVEMEGIVAIGESDEQIKEFIQTNKPDLVGITSTLSSLESSALNISKLVKEVNPRIITVLGGNHITFSNKDFDVDYVIRGEGEIAFIQLLNNLKKGIMPNKNIRGISLEDLSNLPFPARDLMNMDGYFKINRFHSSRSTKRVLNVMTSRGCPENCSFCTTPKMRGCLVRFRNPETVVQEIKDGIDKYRIEEVQFEDDTLTLNIRNLYTLCELLEPLNISWCVPNGIRINYHTDKQETMFSRMKQAGCYQVTLACESGNQRVLDDILNKNLKLEQIKPTISKAKKAGLLVHTFWLVGSPGETRGEMEETIKFAGDCGADSYSVSILCPLPGSKVYDSIMNGNLWWDNHYSSQMLYSKSLFRVDGFKNAEEFENWVKEQNAWLNKGNTILIKQT
jgi:anaerobic magnesium-protoporphyrin IX monomethyl ester cyclase